MSQRLICRLLSHLNPHMHKMGPRGSIFGDQFYPKNVRRLRFHEFLHFYVRKHMISSFHLKWTEFTRNFEFCSNLVWVPEDQKLKQNSQFPGNSVQFRKIMITHVF